MGKAEAYRERLRALPAAEWEAYLRAESGLPGPRGNLELAQAVVELGEPGFFHHLNSFDPDTAPTNTPGEFLAFCGVCGLGRLIAEGQGDLLVELRAFASDPRWRVREAVAIALQYIGKADPRRMIEICEGWSAGSWLEKRAVVAGLAEPALLKEVENSERILGLFDRITADLAGAPDRKEAGYRVLRQALGYAWSVVAAAFPQQGIILMEKWLESCDPDVRWVMHENLKKKRLQRAAPQWTETWQARLAEGTERKNGPRESDSN